MTWIVGKLYIPRWCGEKWKGVFCLSSNKDHNKVIIFDRSIVIYLSIPVLKARSPRLPTVQLTVVLRFSVGQRLQACPTPISGPFPTESGAPTPLNYNQVPNWELWVFPLQSTWKRPMFRLCRLSSSAGTRTALVPASSRRACGTCSCRRGASGSTALCTRTRTGGRVSLGMRGALELVLFCGRCRLGSWQSWTLGLSCSVRKRFKLLLLFTIHNTNFSKIYFVAYAFIALFSTGRDG